MTTKGKNNNSDGPLVSVITPSFNQGAFIRETIESVRTQDYPNIEYIVVDGGSTDSTIDVLKSYGDDLRWVSEKDEGQSDAINKGFKMASGDIFAWLNSDDTYLPGAITRIVEAFNTRPEVGVIYGMTNYIETSGKVIDEYPTGPFDLKSLAVTNSICQPSTFFKRTAWEDANGLDQSLHFTMDYDLWIRLAKKEKFYYIEELLSTYRLHADAKTTAPRFYYLMHKEILSTVVRNFGWAPANRVYAYCNHLIKEKTPLKKDSFLTITLSLLLSLLKYMTLNKGMPHLTDLTLLTPGNIKKILHGRFGGASEYDL